MVQTENNCTVPVPVCKSAWLARWLPAQAERSTVIARADCPLPLRMLSFFSRAGTSREKKTRLPASKALLAPSLALALVLKFCDHSK